MLEYDADIMTVEYCVGVSSKKLATSQRYIGMVE